jgi:hypothetical protein
MATKNTAAAQASVPNPSKPKTLAFLVEVDTADEITAEYIRRAVCFYLGNWPPAGVPLFGKLDPATVRVAVAKPNGPRARRYIQQRTKPQQRPLRATP